MKLVRSKTPNPRMLAIAPLVDTFALVALFALIGSTFVLQPGISVSPPFSPFKMGPVSSPHVIAITAGDPPPLFFRSRSLGVEDLRGELETIPTGTATMVITADRSVSYERVLEVANICIELGFDVVLATSLSGEIP